MAGKRVAALLPTEYRIERQGDWEVGNRDWNNSAVSAMDHRNRCSPEALTAQQPVAQAILNRTMPRTFSLKSGDNCRLRSLAEEPVEFGPARIDHPAEAIEYFSTIRPGLTVLPSDLPIFTEREPNPAPQVWQSPPK